MTWLLRARGRTHIRTHKHTYTGRRKTTWLKSAIRGVTLLETSGLSTCPFFPRSLLLSHPLLLPSSQPGSRRDSCSRLRARTRSHAHTCLTDLSLSDSSGEASPSTPRDSLTSWSARAPYTSRPSPRLSFLADSEVGRGRDGDKYAYVLKSQLYSGFR